MGGETNETKAAENVVKDEGLGFRWVGFRLYCPKGHASERKEMVKTMKISCSLPCAGIDTKHEMPRIPAPVL
jgi:hypothetical protein